MVSVSFFTELMGTKRSMQSLRNGIEEKISVPPGFVSLTSLTLKRTANASEEATDNMAVETIDPLSNHAIKKFKTSLNQRPWILHNQSDRALQNYNLEETKVDTVFSSFRYYIYEPFSLKLQLYSSFFTFHLEPFDFSFKYVGIS